MNNHILSSMAKPVVFLITFFLVANLPQVILSLRIGIRPADFYLMVIAINLALAFLLGYIQHINRNILPYFTWYTVVLLYCIASLVLVNNTDNAVRAMVPLASQAAISLSFVLMIQSRELVRVAALAAATATLFAAGVSIVEFLNPDFNIINDRMFASKQEIGRLGRVGGVHSNPNANAHTMVLGFFVSQFFLSKRFRLPFALLIGFAVFTTVSRSGLMMWVLAVGISFFIGAYATGKVLPKILAFGSVVLLSVLLVSGQIPTILEVTGLDQYMTKSMIVRLSGSFASAASGSDSGRIDLASQAISIYREAPIFGKGLGASESLGYSELGAHNMYLKFGAELGTVGIFLMIGIIWVAIKARSRMAMGFCALYMFSNLFTHNNLEKPALSLLIPLGLFLTAYCFEQTNGKMKGLQKRQPWRSRQRHGSPLSHTSS